MLLLLSFIKALAKHYKVNAENALTEWRVKVRPVLNTLKKHGDMTLQETRLCAVTSGDDRGTIASLYNSSACLGFLTTADCERGFSVLKLTKTALRNWLGEDNLNNAMLCHITHIPLHPFNFKRATEIFVKNGKGKTRLTWGLDWIFRFGWMSQSGLFLWSYLADRHRLLHACSTFFQDQPHFLGANPIWPQQILGKNNSDFFQSEIHCHNQYSVK